MSDIINVAIVDDDPFYRELLKAQLAPYKNIRIVIEVSNGKELIVYLRKHKIHIVLLDLYMPVMDGTATIKYLTKYYRDIKTIILTLHTDKLKSYDLIINKAWGLLHKNKEIDKVADAIYTVHKGVYYIEGSWDLSKILKEKKIETNKKVKEKSILLNGIKFSKREEEVLKLICKQYTAKEISDKLCISTKTVDGHRDSMLQKTNSKNIIGLIFYLIDTGLIKRFR
jgi:DNA-binding NarL/FixJ family response regulator